MFLWISRRFKTDESLNDRGRPLTSEQVNAIRVVLESRLFGLQGPFMSIVSGGAVSLDGKGRFRHFLVRIGSCKVTGGALLLHVVHDRPPYSPGYLALEVTCGAQGHPDSIANSQTFNPAELGKLLDEIIEDLKRIPGLDAEDLGSFDD